MAKSRTPVRKSVVAVPPGRTTVPSGRKPDAPPPVTTQGREAALRLELDGASPGLYNTYVGLKDVVSKLAKQSIAQNLVLARKLQHAVDKHGETSIAKLAGKLDLNRDYIGGALQVVKRLKAESIDSLTARATEANRVLSWNHLVALARMESDADRTKAIDLVITEGLSVAELQQRSMALAGAKRSSGGRPFVMPRGGLGNVLGGMHAFADKFRRYNTDWQTHFAATTAKLSPEDWDAEAVEQVNKTADELQLVADEAAAQAQALRDAARTAQRGRDDEEEDEDEDDAVLNATVEETFGAAAEDEDAEEEEEEPAPVRRSRHAKDAEAVTTFNKKHPVRDAGMSRVKKAKARARGSAPREDQD